jgi:hypothetical protein
MRPIAKPDHGHEPRNAAAATSRPTGQARNRNRLESGSGPSSGLQMPWTVTV